MQTVFHHRLRVYRGLLLTVLALGGLLLGAVSAGAEEKSWSLMGGYAKEEGTFFNGTYRLSPSWQLNLRRLEERLQFRAAYLPVPNLSLQAGYDFTNGQYLAGLTYRHQLGENTAFLADATGYRRRDVNEYLLEYQCDLEIGVSEDFNHLVFAGIRGEYIPGKPHEPEIYVKIDANWYFGKNKNWHIHLEPLVLVEGRIDYKTAVSWRWPGGTEVGVYYKNEELLWDAGIFFKL